MGVNYNKRSSQRAYVVQVLYQADMVDKEPLELVEQDLLSQETRLLDDYGRGLLSGITEKKTELDERISDASNNWSLDRMPSVDRSILRLATYETLFMDEIPVSVAINEAVNLAKKFGGDDSPRFVNGILGRIAHVEVKEPADDVEDIPVTTLDLSQPTEDEAVAAIMEAINSSKAEKE